MKRKTSDASLTEEQPHKALTATSSSEQSPAGTNIPGPEDHKKQKITLKLKSSDLKMTAEAVSSRDTPSKGTEASNQPPDGQERSERPVESIKQNEHKGSKAEPENEFTSAADALAKLDRARNYLLTSKNKANEEETEVLKRRAAQLEVEQTGLKQTEATLRSGLEEAESRMARLRRITKKLMASENKISKERDEVRQERDEAREDRDEAREESNEAREEGYKARYEADEALAKLKEEEKIADVARKIAGYGPRVGWPKFFKALQELQKMIDEQDCTDASSKDEST